jgi:hypothetical protein
MTNLSKHMAQHIYQTRLGKKWCCSDPQCLAERDNWDDENDDLVHCSTENCHGVVWTEKGLQCTSCEKWYCICCWQNTGKFDDDDDDKWFCDACCRKN